MRRMSDKTLARLRKAKAALRRKVGSRSDIVSLSIGYKERAGRIVQRGCVRVHVEKKREMAEIPPALRLPKSIRGVPVDVVESTFDAHATNPSSRCNPLMGGIVVTGAKQFASSGKVGTVGCIVTGLGAPLLLSCWHVLYGPSGTDDDDVVQPTPSGTANNIGKTRAGLITDQVDCAVAELNASRTASSSILEIPAASLIPSTPRPGLLVTKSGANGLGLGVIIGTEGDPVVTVGGVARVFIDQIEIIPRPGFESQFNTGAKDSGALWFADDDGGVVGLHFAGSAGRALANPISAVSAALAGAGISLGF